MILNSLEKALMNNPVRTAIQRYFEVPRFIKMGQKMKGGTALEVGCGRGVGVDLILDLFGAGQVDAFDLDPQMVDLARKRLAHRESCVRLWTGDATAIPTGDDSYDAVFDFGIIHHIPSWKDALSEIYRVLKPGGMLYAEEVLDKFILSPVWRHLLDHPIENRFNHSVFKEALENIGFKVLESQQLWKRFAWFVAKKSDRIRSVPQ